MRRLLQGLLLITVSQVFYGNGSCQYNHYVLELKPTQDGLWRRLSFRRVDGEKTVEFPAEELDLISKLYPVRLGLPKDLNYAFEGTFPQELPLDIGGFGRFLRIDSSLGRVLIYSERFRGDDDQAALYQKSAKAADRLMEMVGGWLEQNLKDQAGFARLKIFLNQQVRGDLANLLFYSSLAFRMHEYHEPIFKETIARLLQYLAERGYLDLQDIPSLSAAFYGFEFERKTPILMTWVERLLARKMGIMDSEPIPNSLVFLSDVKTAQDSLDNYLRTTPEYQKLRKAFDEKKTKMPHETPPEPTEVLLPLFHDLHLLNFSTDDRLTVHLTIPVEPFSSNGIWEANKKRVAWQNKAIVGEEAFPRFVYAAWSEPDVKFQKAHFGKVALEGEKLAEYVFWRQALSAPEANQWEEFLRDLKPDKNLPSKIEGFRFSEESTPPEQLKNSRSLTEIPRTLFFQALSPKVQ